jgi:hypothetical protein
MMVSLVNEQFVQTTATIVELVGLKNTWPPKPVEHIPRRGMQ